MPKRTYKGGHLISTFPCNNGYCTSVYGKYGETLHSEYDYSYVEAVNTHHKLVQKY